MAEFRDAPRSGRQGLAELVKDMHDGKVGTLLIVGGNPSFNALADARFNEELQKVSRKLRPGLYFDHTSEKCDWHLPLWRTTSKGWGDAEAGDGSLCCVQPLIAPLNSGKASDAAPARGGRRPSSK